MALFPSLILILGSLALVAVRGGRSRSVSLISAGSAIAAVMALSQQLPAVERIALWRPGELFGPGFIFQIDGNAWPFLILGSAAVLSDTMRHGRSRIRLLYGGVALAAIAGGNLLTIAMLWTLMILLETAMQTTDAGAVEFRPALNRFGAQFMGVLAAMAAALLGGEGAGFLALAVLLRSFGGIEARSASELAVLAPLGALAAISRFSPQLAAVPWIAGAAISAVLIHSLFYRSRLSLFALALVATGFLAPPEAQTAVWITLAAVLVVTVGSHQARELRFGWLAVSAVAFAFFTVPSEPGLWVLATLSTAALVAIFRLQPRSEPGQDPKRLEAVGIAVLFVAAALALVGSGWLPDGRGALVAGLGLAAGYAIARMQPAVISARLPRHLPLAAVRRLGWEVSGGLGSAVRTAAEVLEGEGAVLWILLVVLIAIIGLQAT